MTYKEKKAAYLAHQYWMPAPAVTTAGWTTGDWIKFIDREGRWL